MFSLSEIIFAGSPAYIKYFSRKTGFLVSDFPAKYQSKLRWLWRHLSKKYDFNAQFSTLLPEEKNRFNEILLNSGYSPLMDDLSKQLEEKIPWIFSHPVSGIFIPLEVIKLLMREETFFRENYLFSILYRLKIHEQKNFASLIGGTPEGQVNLSFEDNPLDMALVLYIWLIGAIRKIRDIREIIPVRGRIIKGPFAFERENTPESPEETRDLSNLLPQIPVPIWDYLYHNFGHLKEDIDKLQNLIKRGNKGFYRSLALLPNQDCDLIRAFKSGILIPVVLFSKTKSAPTRFREIRVVSPLELKYSLELNQTKNQESGKVL